MMRIITLVCVLIGCYSNLHSQDSRFRHITTEQGLSQNSVLDIVEDHNGYMWLATQDGLNKYNGRSFNHYQEYFIDITKNDHAQLGFIFLDNENILWISTSQGDLKYYNESSDEFITLDGLSQISSMLDYGDVIFAGSYDGFLYRIDKLEGKWKISKLDYFKTIYHLQKQEDQIYLATSSGLKRFDVRLNAIDKNFHIYQDIPLSKVLESKDGQFIICSYGNGVFKSSKISTEGKKIKNLPEDLIIMDVLEDHLHNIWFACFKDGAYVLQADNTIRHHYYDAANIYSINYKDILSLYQNSQHDIWLGTDGGGVSFFNHAFNEVKTITNYQTPKNIFVDVPRSIAIDDKNRMWVGTSGHGLSMIDNELNKSVNINSGNSKISTDRIVSLYFDPIDKLLWIGTQEGGLYNYDTEAHKLSEQIDIPLKTVWTIRAKNKDHLWIGSRDEGLFSLNKKNLNWSAFKLEGKDGRTKKNVRDVFVDSDSLSYVAFEDGTIFKLDLASDDIIEIPIKLDNDQVVSGPIKCLIKKADQLWIGTQKYGLISYNENTRKTKNFNTESGLPNNVVYGILEDANGNFWISTNKGICQLNYDHLVNEKDPILNMHLTKKNGLVSSEFNTGAFTKDGQGNLFFGGLEGVNWFHPSNLAGKEQNARIVFEEMILQDGTNTSNINLTINQDIQLKHHQKDFQISYSLLDFPGNEKSEYQYKLDPIQDEWVYNSNNQIASFTNIEPGAYTFRVKATDHHNAWIEKSVDFSFEIIPAFWQTLLFKIIALFLLLALIYLISWYVSRETKRKTLLDQKIKLSEAVALRAQMNPHFLFNSLNSIDNYILNHKPKEASEYLSKFSKLVRRILDYSTENRISLKDELNLLKLYVDLEKMRFSNRFTYQFDIEKEISLEEIHVPPMILQPFVENAIWHGIMHAPHEGQLDINVKANEKNLYFEIDDNGIGREKAQKIKSKSATLKKSHGMKITEERIRLNNELYGMGGAIKTIDKIDEFGGSAGTKVIIKIPKQYQYD